MTAPAAAPAPLPDLLAAAGLYTLSTDPPPDAVEDVLRKLVASLYGADPLRRAMAQAEAVKVLTEAKVSRPAALVDAAFTPAKSQDRDTDTLQGQAVALSDPEPWPQPVDGGTLLAELSKSFARYASLPPGAATANALWTLHTYTLDAAAVSALLALLSPQKRCGKTTVLTLLSALVRRPLSASNITPAVLFRVVEMHRPTLLLDEADSFMDDRGELRNLLNAGHTRAAAWVFRSVGDDHEPRAFSVWGAKAIARIGELPDTLADRAIAVRLQRKGPDDKVERLRLDRIHGELEATRRRCMRWAADNLEALRQADPEVPEELNDRAADNWRPLLAIADAARGEWPGRARKAALLLSGTAVADDSAGVLLLSDLRDLFTSTGRDRLPSEEIVQALAKMEERPWPEWKAGKPLTVRQLAKLLRPFGITPTQYRDGDRAGIRGYRLADMADALSRYVAPAESLQALHPSTDAKNDTFPERYAPNPVADAEKAENPHRDTVVAHVADGAEGSRPGMCPKCGKGRSADWRTDGLCAFCAVALQRGTA